ncbi:MAG: S41 family peptidase [Breznakibacter sp.]
MKLLRVLLVFVVFNLFHGFAHGQVAGAKELHKLQVAWQIINTLYVDTVNSAQLSEAAIQAMLQQLDPHSSYISAKELSALNEPLEGSFDGIGIEFSIIRDTLVVASVIGGGPSEKVGLQVNDRIVKIDDKDIAGNGLTNSQVFKLLRGKKGSKVVLTVVRKAEKQPLVFDIRRDKIPIFSVDASYMIDQRTGYIKISRFGAQTHEEFVKSLKDLVNQGMKGLMIDLRGNGGGYLKAAFDIADELIDDNKMIVYTKGQASPLMEFKSSSKGLFEKGALVVLIDEGSASASEIVAGAIQDWDRGVIVGRRSFGKGLVQRPIKLPDGSEIRLTTAKYYTPSGRCIQKSYQNGTGDYEKEIFQRLQSGELSNQDSLPVKGHERYQTLMAGRTVYGGGGIYPDRFVPLDTTRMSPLMQSIFRTGLLQRYSVSLMENYNGKLAGYKDFDSFLQAFLIEDAMLSLLVDQAAGEGIVCSIADLRIEEMLLTQIKAYLARRLFNTSEFYRVVNPQTDIYKQGVDILTKTRDYNQLLK